MERLGNWVFIAYKDVANLSVLLADKNLLAHCAMLNGNHILSKLHLACAIQRLSVSTIHRTRNIVTEIVVALSPTKHISEATNNFWVADPASPVASGEPSGELAPTPSSAQVIVFALFKPTPELVNTLTAEVEGVAVSLDHLSQYANNERIAKIYSLTAKEVEMGLEAAVVGRISVADL